MGIQTADVILIRVRQQLLRLNYLDVFRHAGAEPVTGLRESLGREVGVDSRHESNGLGAGLLADAVGRLLILSDDIGCRGLLIHAESEEARSFYLHLIPELQQSPTDELHLVLLLKDARRSLRGD